VVAVTEGEAIVDGVIVVGVEADGVVAEALIAEGVALIAEGVALIAEGVALIAEGEVSTEVEGVVAGDEDKGEEERGPARLQPSKDRRSHLTECLMVLLMHMLYVYLTSNSALYPC